MKKTRSLSTTWWRFIGILPLALPALLAVYGLWLVILMLAGKFVGGALLAGLILLLPTWVVLWRLLPSEAAAKTKERRFFDLAVLGFVLIWCGFNAHYSARHILADRDPGLYGLAAVWLKDHPTTNLAVDKPFGNAKGVIEHSVGIWNDVNAPKDGKVHLQPQGMHLLPALAAAAGKIGGAKLLFASNVLFGGAALLALYGFSRELMRPRWAALASLVFAATLPLVYFSKDLYTEPLAATFTMGALALTWIAYENRAKTGLLLWLLSGVVAGASVLTRADGYLTVVALMTFLVIATLLEKNRRTKDRLIKAATVFFAGAIPPMLAGYLDITRLTSSYYITNERVIKIQLALLALVVLGGAASLFITGRTKILKNLDRLTKKWRTKFAIGAFLAGALLLMSRPLWLKKYEGFQNGTTYLTQIRQGLPVEPRTYAEHTVDWVGWYMGALLLAAAVFGMVVMIKKVFDDAKFVYLALLILTSLTSLIFFVNPEITPDHIWASRRFLAVIIPCLITAGIYAASYLYENTGTKNSSYKVILAVAAAFYLVLQPLLITRPFVRVNEHRTEYDAFVSFCRKLPDNAAVLWVSQGSLALNAVQSTRAVCGVKSAGYTMSRGKPATALDGQKLQRIAAGAKANGLEPYIAIQGSTKNWITLDASIQNNLNPVSVYGFTKVEQTLTGPPRVALAYADSFELGRIHEDGSVSAVK